MKIFTKKYLAITNDKIDSIIKTINTKMREIKADINSKIEMTNTKIEMTNTKIVETNTKMDEIKKAMDENKKAMGSMETKMDENKAEMRAMMEIILKEIKGENFEEGEEAKDNGEEDSKEKEESE